MRTVSGLTLLVAILAIPTAGGAVAKGIGLDERGVLSERFQQRTDVEEVLLPPPPRGPATPLPFCSPSAPFCP